MAQKKSESFMSTEPRMIRLSLAIAMLMPLASPAMAQMTIKCPTGLRFGNFATHGGNGGRITVTPGGGVNTTGNIVTLTAPQNGVCKVASFATTGSLQIKVSMDTMNVTGGTGVMSVNNFNIGTAAAGETKTYLSASLTATPLAFGVGGRLNINNNQVFGGYSGSITMTAIFTM